MTARRRSRTRSADRASATNYLKKAEEFFESMNHALQVERWNAVGLNAVHCAISSCDAVLVYYTRQRSASPDHETAVYLLNDLTKVPDARQKADTLRRILNQKNEIEYEDRTYTAREAAEIAKLTERFYHWSREKVSV